jgi:DnaT-like ssDNA binding protein
MAADIDATVGGGSSNSFVTADEFTAYTDTRLNIDAYTNASSGDRDKALMEATRELNVLRYGGNKATTGQALLFPRFLLIDPDSMWYTFYDSAIIPQRIKDATCELALEFLKGGTTDMASLDQTIGIKSETVGPIRTEYTDPTQRAQGIARFPRVLKLIRPLLENTFINSIPIVRG